MASSYKSQEMLGGLLLNKLKEGKNSSSTLYSLQPKIRLKADSARTITSLLTVVHLLV